MMELDMQGTAEIVQVDFEKGKDGLLFATSADLPGLFLAERDLEELHAEIPEAIKALYVMSGRTVDVVRAMKPADTRTPLAAHSWVVFEHQEEETPMAMPA